MPDDSSNEFIELIELYLEDALDPAGHDRLVELLQSDPSLLGRVSEHLSVSTILNHTWQHDEDFVSRVAANIRRIASEGEFEFANRIKRTIIRRRWVKALAIAALVFLAVQPFIQQRAKNPEVVATLVRLSSENEVIASTPVYIGSSLEESSGLVRLDFKNGAVMAVEAPSKLKVVSGMEIRLDSGRLNGWCPESAHGFKVRTSTALLTDLGTSFGVTATKEGESKFLVLTGLVRVKKGEEEILLKEGHAIQSSGSDNLRSVPFDPAGFKTTWSLANGILATTGAVVPATPDIPEKLVEMEDDDHILVIPESRQIPFKRRILAEINGPGTIPGDFNRDFKVIEPIPGKQISSFIIRYNPVGVVSEDKFVHFQGQVTFDRPVLAIACQNFELTHGDPVFATAAWPKLMRGIELTQLLNPPDSVTLSKDRRTVSVSFHTGAATDDIRVILDDNPEVTGNLVKGVRERD